MRGQKSDKVVVTDWYSEPQPYLYLLGYIFLLAMSML